MTLMQMSISAAVLIVIITILRAVFINKLSKKTFMLLWGLVLFRLLIPVSIPSVFSIYSLIPVNKSQVIEPISQLSRRVVVSDVTYEGITKIEVQRGFNLPYSLWTILWGIGLLLCVSYFIIAYYRGIKKFKNSMPVENDFIKEWKEKHTLKRKLSIRVSNQVCAPLSYGILKPVILLPKDFDFDNTKALNYILTHEYIHIRHFDILTKILMIAALSIHWFNPMVWVMFLLINRDIELVCDETVVQLFGEQSRSSYVNTLIDMEIQKSALMPLCNNFSKNVVEERIGAIMKMKKRTVFSLGLSGIFIVGITMALAISAQTKGGLTLAEENMLIGEVIGENSKGSDIILAQEMANETIADMEMGKSEEPLSLGIQLENGEKREFGPFGTAKELLDTVYYEEQATEQGTALTPDELEKLYSVYKPFGLTYDKHKDCFYYKGKLVREFIDVMKSNGESLFSGKFKGTLSQIENPKGEGEIVIYTIRDYEKKDKFGNGILIGIKEGY